MVSCPNKNTPEWKALANKYGEKRAMVLFTLNRGVIPSEEVAKDISNRITRNKGRKFLEDRFGSGRHTIYSYTQNIGNSFRQGYFDGFMFHIWDNAEEGTEYHEAFHGMFRLMLNKEQRADLYKEASTKFTPTKKDLEALQESIPQELSQEELTNLFYEEKMADGFREFILTGGEIETEQKARGWNKIVEFFKNLFDYILTRFNNKITIKKSYEFLRDTASPSDILRSVDQLTSEYDVNSLLDLGNEKEVKENIEWLSTLFQQERLQNPQGFARRASNYIQNTLPRNLLRMGVRDRTTEEPIDSQVASLLLPLLQRERTFEVYDLTGRWSEEIQTKYDALIDSIEEVLIDNNVDYDFIDGELFFPHPTEDLAGNPYKGLDENDKQLIAEKYQALAREWKGVSESEEFDGVKMNNTLVIGWSTLLKRYLSKINIELRQSFEEENDNLELEAAEHMSGYSFLRENPAKKLGEKVVTLLRTIPSRSPNTFGEYSFLDPDPIIKDLMGIFPGAVDFNDMLARLRRHARFQTHLQPVYDRFQVLTELDRNLIWANFALAHKEFSLIQETEKRDEMGGVQIEVKIINPATTSAITRTIRQWSKNAVATEEDSRRFDTLYVIKDGKLLPNGQTARKLYNAIEEFRKYDGQAFSFGYSNAFADYLWFLGARYAEDQTDHRNLVYEYLQEGIDLGEDKGIVDRANLINRMVYMPHKSGYNSMNHIASSYLGIKINKSRLDKLKPLPEATKNVFDQHQKSYSVLAEAAEVLTPIPPNTHTTGTNVKMYPINLPDSFDDFTAAIRNSEKRAALVTMFESDPFFNTGYQGYDSVILRILRDFPDLTELLNNKTLDSYKSSKGFAIDYSQQGKRTSIFNRVYQFLNNSNKSQTYISSDTLADRSRQVFNGVPRLETILRVMGLTRKELWEGLLIQDLIRYREAERDLATYQDAPGELIADYHYAKFQKISGSNVAVPIDYTNPEHREYLFNRSGSAFNSELMQIEGMMNEELYPGTAAPLMSDNVERFIEAKNVREEDRTNDQHKLIRDFYQKIDEQVATLEANIKIFADEIKEELKSNKNKFKKSDLVALSTQGSPTKEDAYNEMIESFVANDVFWKVEAMKPFTVHVSNAHGYVKHVKRAGSIGTPGNRLAKAEEFYGVRDEIRTVTVYDVAHGELATEEERQMHTEDIESVRQKLLEQNRLPESDPAYVSTMAMELILDSLKLDRDAGGEPNMNRTDASGFISMKFYRDIKSSIGTWSTAENEAYYNDKNGLGAVDNNGNQVFFPPIKPMTEGVIKVGNRVFRVLDKTALVPITKEFASMFKKYDDIYNRLNALEDYQDLTEVDIVYVDSARKTLAKGIRHMKGEPGELRDTAVVTIPSERMRLPQNITHKDKQITKFPLQVRKGLLSNLRMDGIYNVGDVQVTGQELFDRYQEAMSEKFNRSLRDFAQKLNISTEGFTTNIKSEAEFIKAMIRIAENAIETNSGLHVGYTRALTVTRRPNGSPATSVPFGFPTLRKLVESSMFSAFRKEVYEQFVPGTEVVQIAELGGHKANGQLRGTHIEGSDVVEMEINLRIDVAKRFGIDPSTPWEDVPEELKTIIGFRIPNAMRSMTVVMKIKNILPQSSSDVMMVPPQFTKLTGSDFDIDKVFIIFPEANEGQKVDAEWAEKTPATELTTQQLNNVIFDVAVAIGKSPMHLGETMLPIDGPMLKAKSKEYAEKIPSLSKKIHRNNPLMDIEMEMRNKFGNINTGIYASAISQRNVAQFLNISARDTYGFKLDGVNYTRVMDKMSDTEVFNDLILNYYVNEAIDAAKDPKQWFLNDFGLTPNMNIMTILFGVPHEAVRDFMNQPIIRALNEEYVNEEASPGHLRRLLDKVAKRFTGKNFPYDKMDRYVTKNMSSAKLAELGENSTPDEQMTYLKNFFMFYKAAQNLAQVRKAITPDNLGNVSETAAIRDYMELHDSLFSGDNIITGWEHLFNPQEGMTDYSFQRAAFRTLQFSLNMASNILPTEKYGARILRAKIKQMLGKQRLSMEDIRVINNSLLHYMVTNPYIVYNDETILNPIGHLLDAEDISKKFLGKDLDGLTAKHIGTIYSDLVQKYPELRNSLLIKNISPEVYSSYESDIFSLGVSDLLQLTGVEKSQALDMLNTLLIGDEYQLGIVLQLPESEITEEIKADMKELGELIIQDIIINKGLLPSSRSHADLLPPEWIEFTGLGEYFYKQQDMLSSIPSFGSEFLKEFILNDIHNIAPEIKVSRARFNAAPNENITEMLQRPITLTSNDGVYRLDGGFIDVVVLKVDGMEVVALNQNAEGVYKVIGRKSVKNNLNEMNLTTTKNDKLSLRKSSIFTIPGYGATASTEWGRFPSRKLNLDDDSLTLGSSDIIKDC